MTPPEAHPTPQPEDKFKNPNISYTEKVIGYPNGPIVRAGIQVKQGDIDSTRHIHGQDFATTNFGTIIEKRGGYPAIAIADGVSTVSQDPQVENISASLAKEGATTIANAAATKLLTAALVREANKALHEEFTTHKAMGRSTLAAAQFTPRSHEVRIVNIGDSQAFVVVINTNGEIEVIDYTHKLQQGMKDEEALTSTLGSQRPKVNTVVHYLPPDTKRAFVILASDGIKTWLNRNGTTNEMPDTARALLISTIIQKLRKGGALTTKNLTHTLLRISNAFWERHSQASKDDQSIAIMEITYPDQVIQERLKPEWKRLIDSWRTTNSALTRFWADLLYQRKIPLQDTPKTKPIGIADIQTLLEALPIPGDTEQIAKRIFEALKTRPASFDTIPQEGGFRELVKARWSLWNRIKLRLKKAFANVFSKQEAKEPPTIFHGYDNEQVLLPLYVFRAVRKTIERRQRKLRKKLREAKTLEDIINALQDPQAPPFLISKDQEGFVRVYSTSLYAEMVRHIAQVLKLGINIPDNDLDFFTNAAGLREAISKALRPGQNRAIKPSTKPPRLRVPK